MTVDEDYNYKELQEKCREDIRNAKYTPGKIVNCPQNGENYMKNRNYNKYRYLETKGGDEENDRINS